MRNLMVIAEGVNVHPLRLSLKRQPWLWNKNNERTISKESPHHQVDDIWVRFGNKSQIMTEHISQWYSAYYALPELKPIIFDLMRLVEGEQLGGILITRIPPGGKVLKHADYGWHAEYYDKYIVQVEGNQDQSFCYENEHLSAETGTIYWFENSATHWVNNDSDTDRISLIICIRSNRQKVICNE